MTRLSCLMDHRYSCRSLPATRVEMHQYGRTRGKSRHGTRGPLAALIVVSLSISFGFWSTPATATAPAPVSPRGYILAAADGGVFAFGRSFRGSVATLHLRAPVVGIASTPGDAGYWLAAADGGVFAFGGARFLGSFGGRALNAPIVGIASTPDGGGYWLVGSDGGVFAFGDARFFGSLSGAHILAPVVGIASTRDGGGYRLLTESGELFSFGNALAPGDPPAVQAPLGRYVAIMRLLRDARGVVIATSDGALMHFNDGAGGCNSGLEGPGRMNAPVVGLTAASAWCAQLVAGSDGGVFSLGGGTPFHGSAANLALSAPIVGIAS
jgi:hypothetical protein